MQCVGDMLGLVSDILGGHRSIIDSSMEQFVGCVRGVIGDLDLVGNFVPHLAISPFFLRDTSRRNSAQVGRDFNEFFHTSCLRLVTSQLRCGDLKLENGLTVIFVLGRSFIVRVAAG